MKSTTDRGADARPVHDTCDFCRHPHACYVGGRPALDPATQATHWKLHVCLGCLMRAATPSAFDGCGDRSVPAPPAGARGSRDA